MSSPPGGDGASPRRNGASPPAAPGPSAEGPTYEALEQAATVVIQRAAEIGAAGASAPVSNEWQGVFAAARTALRPPPAESAAIASFGMRTLVGRSGVLDSQSSAARARAQTLAATVVELYANRQAGAATALSSLVAGISGDESLTQLLPFYVCLEALVRCRLADDTGGSGPNSARAYWRLALAEAEAASHARLVLCGGLSGSGKSFVANGIAAAYGARVVASDAVRKRLAGLEPRQPTPPELNSRVYSGRMSDKVYRLLVEEAWTELEAGRPVVLDATYLVPTRRAEPLELARSLGVPAAIAWCSLAEVEARVRLAARGGKPWAVSDADIRIRALQRSGMQPPLAAECGATLLRVDAGAPPALLFARLLPRLRRALAAP